MLCAECNYTDGMEYLSDPVKIRCLITGEFHTKDFNCNCECSRLFEEDKNRKLAKDKFDLKTARAAVQEAESKYFRQAEDLEFYTRPLQVKMPDEQSLADFKEMLNSQPLSLEVVTVGSTNCLACGAEVQVNLCDNYTKICDDCQKAIRFIKERFKGEYNV